MDKRIIHLLLLAGTLHFISCKNMPSQNHGPIVLGDSSMIVTETDPQKLQDLVTDLKPTITPAENKDTAATVKPTPAPAVKDTPKKANPLVPALPQPALIGNGLKADFGIASFLIPNVSAKQSGKASLEHANGVVYTWTSGTINNNMIKVTANVQKVSMRYQTVIVLKNELGVLPLETLTTTTDWAPMKGVNNVYQITGLNEKSLDYSEANKNAIRAAVSKSAHRHRMSRRRMQDWENSARNVRAVNQKPLYVVLRSVMWKIDGKDNNGKLFSKQIRIDMPL